MLGISLKIAAVTIFVAMLSLIKAAAGIPAGELVFFRSFFAFFPLAAFLAIRGNLRNSWKTKRLPFHILRGIIGVCAMSLIFFAVTQLPLPELTTLTYTTPLVLVALSAIILKEKVQIYRWSAVLIGLLGVLIVVWPRLTLFTSGAQFNAMETLGAVSALAGAAIAAVGMITTRSLVTTESSATIVLYFSLASSAVALFTLPFGWVMPNPTQWALLVSAGVLGGIGQILLTESYRHAEMSIIAPFEYTSLIWSIIIGYLVFADVPTPHTITGGLIVIAAGIFIILRERALGLERAASKKVSTPQG